MWFRLCQSTVPFAARKSDGSVVAWGEASNGGDASAVADQLSSGIINAVGFSYSFDGYAFAAWKADGTVVAWGNSGLKVKSRCSLNEGFPKLLFPSRGPYNWN